MSGSFWLPEMIVRTVVVSAVANEAAPSRTEFVTSKLSLAPLSQPGRSGDASLAEVSVAVPACCPPLGAPDAPAVARVEKYSTFVRLPFASCAVVAEAEHQQAVVVVAALAEQFAADEDRGPA